MSVRIGPYTLANNVFVAPMAGVTDRPFRQLCKALGAGYAVSEMVTSRKDLWDSLKTSRRANHAGEPGPISVQIAGTDAPMMAEAAVYNIERGAQIIDINMGCPAKKVCNKWAGSALMQNEPLAVEIAAAVVAAAAPYGVPVTLKMRTGWSDDHKNAVQLARQFEQAGIQMLTVHGRTREQGYRGLAEYDTIRAVKQAVSVPVVANGDITSPAKARDVLAFTGADAVMVGRAAQGRPWIFREIVHFLQTGELLAPPLVAELRRHLLEHLQDHYALYGESTGVRSARKHIAWYVRDLPGGDAFRREMNVIDNSAAQWQAVADYLLALGQQMDRLPGMAPAPEASGSAMAQATTMSDDFV
ncbi:MULTISPECIES: tRNA dihydrouridine synthase DusB [Comamonas]|jgi:tRNA-dihydrouridine synthase B|uniref:tRNA dihydrouridine synthase DusB n=1 Tax=Comamonas TaxID=283 RepID=UPI000DE78783|nr:MULTISPECIES: tRNA dihydrouridine synthase DusB [Comamonas]PWB20220.1 tRNA dihydrouridine synthase DusB [Comamonas sp. JNW]